MELLTIRGKFEALMQIIGPATELIIGALGPYTVEHGPIKLLRMRSTGNQGKAKQAQGRILQYDSI